MPYVSIRIADTLSKEQKKEICQGVTEVISRAANKSAENILVFISEEQRENISKGGVLLADL